MQHFGLLVADFIGIERNGRLHGGHREQLEEMIRHHVAKRARGLIKSAAMLHADGFGGGDLHVVHIIAVPERFDDIVRKAEDHDILYGLFAEVVIDAVDLLFGEDLLQFLVELLCGSQVMPERLFHDDARPAVLFFFRQAALAQHFHDGREKTRRNGQVKKSVPKRVVFLVGFRDLLFEALVSLRIKEITFDVVRALDHPVQQFRIDRQRSKLGNIFCQRFPKALRVEVIRRKANDRKLCRQEVFLSQIAKRGDQLAFGQVPRGAKNRHHTWRRR